MKEELKVYRYGGKYYLKVFKEIDSEYWEATKSLNYTVKENEWMLKHLYSFKPWDNSFNTELFVDSLNKSADYMTDKGHTLNGYKYARRIKYAAKLMARLYGAESYNEGSWLDNSVSHKIENNRFTTVHPFKDDKRYLAYSKINLRKEKENYSSREDTVWSLFRKYYRFLWD